jgi:hypothetical protein
MALPVSGQTGPSTQSDGAQLFPFRQGRQGELVVQELHGRFYEQALRGNLYAAGGSSAFTITGNAAIAGTGAGTCTPLIAFCNPLASKVNGVMLQVSCSFGLGTNTVTGPGQLFWCLSTGNTITNGTRAWSRNNFGQGGGQLTVVAGGGTFVGLTNLLTVAYPSQINAGLPTYSVGTSVGTGVLIVPPFAGQVTENIDGSIVIPPGGVLALMCAGTAVNVTASPSGVWEEVPTTG